MEWTTMSLLASVIMFFSVTIAEPEVTNEQPEATSKQLEVSSEQLEPVYLAECNIFPLCDVKLKSVTV